MPLINSLIQAIFGLTDPVKLVEKAHLQKLLAVKGLHPVNIGQFVIMAGTLLHNGV